MPDEFADFLAKRQPNIQSHREAIEKGAADLGVNPVDYATAMSYESARTFDPWVKGPVTKWGQHRGTIQYGEPQQKQYGVHPGQSFEEQVTTSNVKYLKDHGVRPGASFDQIYSAINGGKVNADPSTPDANTGRTINDNLRLARGHRPEVLKRFWNDQEPTDAFSMFQGKRAQPDEFAQFVQKQPPVLPVTEPPATLDAQLQSTLDPASPKAAIEYTDPSMVPQDARGLVRFDTPDGTTLLINQKKADALGVKDYVGEKAKLLGKINDVGNATTTGPTVHTTAPDGTELSSSIVTSPEAAQTQAAVDQAAYPGSSSQVVAAQDVVAKRQQPTVITDAQGKTYFSTDDQKGLQPDEVRLMPTGENKSGKFVVAKKVAQPDGTTAYQMPGEPPPLEADYQKWLPTMGLKDSPANRKIYNDALQVANRPATTDQRPLKHGNTSQPATAAVRDKTQWKASDKPGDWSTSTVPYLVDFPQNFKGDRKAEAVRQVNAGLKRDFGLTDEQLAGSGVVDVLGDLSDASGYRLHVKRSALVKLIGEDKVKADYDAERAQPTLDAYQRTEGENAKRGAYQVAQDIPALKPTGDPLRDQAQANVWSDPFSGLPWGTSGTDAEVEKEYARLQATTPDEEERKGLETAGKWLNRFDAIGTDTGFVKGAAWLGDIASGAWKLSPIGLLEYATTGHSKGADTLSRLANQGRVIAQSSSDNDTVLFKVGDTPIRKNIIGETLGQAAVQVPTYIGLSALPGGAVMAFASTEGLGSLGRGDNLLDVAGHTIKGGVLGAVFAAAPRIGTLVERQVLRTARNPIFDAAKLPKNPTDAQVADFASRLEFSAETEFEMGRNPAFKARVLEYVREAAQGEHEKQVLVEKLLNHPTTPQTPGTILASKILGATAEIGTIGGGTFAVEKASGASTGDALTSAIVNTLFGLTKHIPFKDLVGKTYRMHDGAKSEDVTIDPDGSVKLLPKGKVPPGGVDAEFDVSKVVDMKPNAEGVYEASGTSSVRQQGEPARLGEAPAKRIGKPLPDAVQKIGLDTRAQKIGDVLADGELKSVQEIAKATRYNPAKVNETIELLYGAGKVEITPDNKIRLIEPLDKGVTSLYERFNDKGVVAPERPPAATEPPQTAISDTKGAAISTIPGSVAAPEASIRASESTSEPQWTPPKEYKEVATTADQARAQGSQTIDGVTYQRQPVIEIPKGRTGKVMFADKEAPQDFHFGLIEADQLQPAHLNGVPNRNHFLPEAQPKVRTDAASKQASDKIGANPDLGQVGDSPNAFSGAPIINSRGEVIQGNNRSEGLKKHYGSQGDSYKTQLSDKAGEFGFTPEQVAKMKSPVLVRVLNADDKKAIELGNYGAADLESGGKQFVDPVTTSARIPHPEKARMVDEIFRNAGEDQTLTEAIRNNRSLIKSLLDPYITDTQKQTLFSDATKDFTSRGVKDIEGVFTHFLFDGGAPDLAQTFEGLPHNTRQGIIASLPKIYSVEQGKSIVPELQNAVLAANDFTDSGNPDWNTWLNQPDMHSEGRSPADDYTPTEQALAKKLLGLTPDPKNPNLYTQKIPSQKDIKDLFAQYAKLANGTQETLFEPAQEALSKADAIKELLNVEHTERTPAADHKAEEVAVEKPSDTAQAEPNTKPANHGIRSTPTADAAADTTGTELRKLEDLSPVERANLKRTIAPKRFQGHEQLSGLIAQHYNVSPAELAKLEPLGEVGKFGQTSHVLKRELGKVENYELFNTFASIFAPEIPKATANDFEEFGNRTSDAEDILTVIAEDAGLPRSSHMAPSDWQTFLDRYGVRLGDDGINTILSALGHQEAWHRNIVRFLGDPALTELNRKVYDIGQQFGWEPLSNAHWGVVKPEGFDETKPAFDLKGNKELVKLIKSVGKSYGRQALGDVGPLSDNTIKEAVVLSIRQAAQIALKGESGTRPQPAKDREDQAPVEAGNRPRQAEELESAASVARPPIALQPAPTQLPASSAESTRPFAEPKQQTLIPPTASLTDFGEKIGGARKDMWDGRGLTAADLEKMTAREKAAMVKKDQIWSKPDYQEVSDRFEAAGIPDPQGHAYAIKMVYDGIAQPQSTFTDEDWNAYVNAVTEARDEIGRRLETPTANWYTGLQGALFGGDIVGSTRYLNSQSEGYKKLRLLGGTKFINRLPTSEYSMRSHIRKAEALGFPSKREAWMNKFAVIPSEKLNVGSGTQKIDGEFRNRYFVDFHGKNVGWVKLGSFETQTEAQEFKNGFKDKYILMSPSSSFTNGRTETFNTKEEAVAKAKELYGAKNKRLEGEPARPQLKGINRTGVDHRNGKPATPESFTQTFGFRGVEFGNWLNDADRQQSLDHAFDALMDLSNVLGVPPRALSLGGNLGLAFGARGKGGKHAGLAHYESSKVVINLTKMSGAGSLAHEWAHAADDYFGSLAAGAKYRTDPHKGFTSEVSRREGLRPEMREAWRNVMSTILEREATNEETVEEAKAEVAKQNKIWDSWVRYTFHGKDGEALQELQQTFRAQIENGILANQGPFTEFLAKTERTLGKVGKKEKNSLGQVASQIARAQVNLGKAVAGEIVKKLPSDYHQHAKNLDKLFRGKTAYWATIREMFARAFESYIQDKTGKQSQYLVHGTDTPTEKFPDEKDNVLPINAYPVGQERDFINAAFDNFVSTLQTKTDESGHTILFTRIPGQVDLWGNPSHLHSTQLSMFDTAPVPQAKLDEMASNEVKQVYRTETAKYLDTALNSEDSQIASVAKRIADARFLVARKGEGAQKVVEDAVDALDIFTYARNLKTTVDQMLPQLGFKDKTFGDKLSKQAVAMARAMETGKFAMEFNFALSKAPGDAPLFMTAWHGSPHRFDKFDSSKIGTGEGAQAYGHGLYFSDAESVAQHYRDALAILTTIYKGNPITENEAMAKFRETGDFEYRAVAELFRYRWTYRWTGKLALSEAIKDEKQAITVYEKASTPYAAEEKAKHQKFLNAFERLQKDIEFKTDKSGAKYRVDLKPEASDYLLWDKPLSEQSEKVKKAIASIPQEMRNHIQVYAPNELSNRPDDVSGGHFYKYLGSAIPDERGHYTSDTGRKASDYLKSLGIRGIKYLDGSSRGKGEGSHNYVIFDDSDVEIKEVHFNKQEVKKARTLAQSVKGLSNTQLVTRAKVAVDGRGILLMQNPAALKRLINAIGQGDFYGAYLNRGNVFFLRRDLEMQRIEEAAHGNTKALAALGDLIGAIDEATDPVHGDFAIAIDFPELPQISRVSQQEELAHRANRRSGAREIFVTLADSPAIKKGVANLSAGYANISVTNAVDEVIAKSFRDDAEAELNLSKQEVRDIHEAFFEGLKDGGIDPVQYGELIETTGRTGRAFKKYAELTSKREQRGGEDVTRRTGQEPETLLSIPQAGREGAGNSRGLTGQGSRPIQRGFDEADREADRHLNDSARNNAGEAGQDLSSTDRRGSGGVLSASQNAREASPAATAGRPTVSAERLTELNEFGARSETELVHNTFFPELPFEETALIKRPSDILFARPKDIPSLDEIEADTQTGLEKVLSYIYDGKRDVTGYEAAMNLIRTGYLAGFSVIKTNLIGNTANIAIEQLSKPAMALVDIANAKYNPKAKGMRYVPGLSLADVTAGLFGKGGLFRAGLLGERGVFTGLVKGVGELESSRVDMNEPGSKNPNFVRNTGIPAIDAVIEATKRLVVTVDRPFKAYARTAEMRGLSRIAAKNLAKQQGAGLLDQEWRKHAKAIRNDPGIMMHDLAERYAEVVTFQNPNAVTDIYDSFKRLLRDEKTLKKILPAGASARVAKHIGGGLYVASGSVAPFVKTPTNIGLRAMEYMLPTGIVSAAWKYHRIGEGFERKHWMEETAQARTQLLTQIASSRSESNREFKAETRKYLDGFKRRKEQRQADWQAEQDAINNSPVFTDTMKRQKLAELKANRAKWLDTWTKKRNAYKEKRDADFEVIDNRRRVADMKTRDEWNAEDVYADVKFTAFENKQFAEAAGRTTFGTVVGGLLFLAVIKGVLDAVGSTDYDDEKGKWYAKRAAGIPDSSVRIGQYRYPYNQNPFGSAMSLGIDQIEQFNRPGPGLSRTGAMFKRLGKDVRALNPLTTGEFTKDDFNSLAGDKANSITPILNLKVLQEAAEVMDAHPRKYWDQGFAAQYLIHIPKLRESLPVSQNYIGGEQERGDLTRRLLRLVDPLKTTRERSSQKTLPKTPLK